MVPMIRVRKRHPFGHSTSEKTTGLLGFGATVTSLQ